MKIAVITSGYLPVPATKGGAVESIVENIIKRNEKYKKMQFEIFSCYDSIAEKKSIEYKNTSFRFINVGNIVKLMDKIVYWIAKNILRKEKTMSYRYIVQRLVFLNKVSKILKQEDYDKIVLENHETLFLALKWRKNYKKYEGRYYYHIHNEIKSDYGCRDIIKKTRKILCVSNYIKEQVKKYLMISENNIEVLKNCIDIEKFNFEIDESEKLKLRKKFGINKEEKVLLFTGRLNREKGIKELLEAITLIKRNDFKLLIVGSFFFGTSIENNFEKEIKDIIEKIDKKIIFTGYIPYDEMQKIYAIADIAILPSMWEEPAGLTIIESMASGLPVITTNSGGIPEYINDNMSITIDRDSNIVLNIKESITELLDNYELRKKMSKYAKENSKKYNLNNYYKKFMDGIEL